MSPRPSDRGAARGPLALVVLGALIGRERHPYEIAAVLRGRGVADALRLTYGSLYSVVAALARAELVEAVRTERDGARPERTVYAITETGRRELQRRLSDLLSTPGPELGSLGPGLSMLVVLPPDEVATLLDQRAERLRFEMRALQATHDDLADRGLAEVMLVERSYRSAMLRAELEYASGLAHGVRANDIAGVSAWRRIHALRAEGRSWQELLQDPAGLLGEDARALGLTSPA